MDLSADPAANRQHSQIKTEHCMSFRISLSTLKLFWCVIRQGREHVKLTDHHATRCCRCCCCCCCCCCVRICSKVSGWRFICQRRRQLYHTICFAFTQPNARYIRETCCRCLSLCQSVNIQRRKPVEISRSDRQQMNNTVLGKYRRTNNHENRLNQLYRSTADRVASYSAT